MSDLNYSKVEQLFENQNTTIAKDLKVNLSRLMSGGALPSLEAGLAVLACAQTTGFRELVSATRESLKGSEVSDDQIQEAIEVAGIMGMLNTYYSFRYKMSQGEGANAADYQTASLRMTALSKPLLGKERFEMLAFAVSVINGCESCIRSHEKALRDLGLDPAKIHDLAKIGSVVKGLKALQAL